MLQRDYNTCNVDKADQVLPFPLETQQRGQKTPDCHTAHSAKERLAR
jgi:hypothetical protein